MAQTHDYQITLYSALREGAFVVTKFTMMDSYPEKQLQAEGIDHFIAQVTHFAMEHGEGCRASVRCLAALNPPFSAAQHVEGKFHKRLPASMSCQLCNGLPLLDASL